MPRRAKIIRVFVSSTFEDLKPERDALQQGAFKNLREYCRLKGWQFQAVDLRWGINNEATIDQRTMEICLREIERCQEQSPRPNFIVLLGERYGWRPLPDRVLQSVYAEMKSQMPAELAQKFGQWYELDENQLPEPVWRLRAREGRYLDFKEYEKEIEQPLVAFFTRWAAEHLPDPDLPDPIVNPRARQRLSMERSATEQEIHAGVFRVADAQEHVFAFFREIPHCPVDNKTYRDDDKAAMQRLVNHLQDFLPSENILPLVAGWDGEHNQPDSAHLARLSDEVESRLKGIIDQQIETYQKEDEDQIEQAAHEAFAAERTFGFSGREKDIEAICAYAASESAAPFIVWGESGTGKSTLLAKAAQRVEEILPQVQVLARFIGITGKSSLGHTLLADLCRNLCALYGGDAAAIPEEPAKLQAVFNEYLAKATAEHPLVLIIDALDQLRDGDPARQLNWFPRTLPPHVSVIFSTLKGECFDLLQQRKEPAPVFYEITPLTADDGRAALDAWLKRANRTLQDHQKEQIIRGFESAGCAPLFLHLAFEQARHWESFKRKQRLGRDIPEMIEDLYENLSRPEAHGSIVEKVLTAIRCAKQGLSNDEILGVLAADDDFWSQFGIQTFHAYEDRHEDSVNSRVVPPVLWIRLYHDLEYYLTRRSAPGGEVITFYHRQLAEAVDTMYLTRPGYRQKRHKALADYFAGKRWLLKETAPLVANVRKCDELPWQRIHSEEWDAVADALCDLDFIQAKSIAKMTFEMVQDFNAALQVIPDNAERVHQEKERQARLDKYTRDLIAYAKGELTTLDVPESVTPWTQEKIEAEIQRIRTNPNHADRLQDFLHFLSNEADDLQNYAKEIPRFAHQQAWNHTEGGPVGRTAEKLSPAKRGQLLLKIGPTRPVWNPLPHALRTLKGHTERVTAVSVTPDGIRAVSGSMNQSLIVWDLESGQALKALQGHTGEVKAVSVTPDSRRAVSGSYDKTLILWDTESGQALISLKGHTGWVTAVSVTPDGRFAVSGSDDKTLIVWDLETGQALKRLTGHTGMVWAVSVTPDGRRAVSGSDDGTLMMWDLESGQALRSLKGHTGSVVAVSVTPDGRRAVSGSFDETLIVWDLETGQALKRLTGHTGSVNCVSVTPDGKRAVSGSWDSTLMVWDLESGHPLRTLEGHTSWVEAVSVAPDGRRAVSSSYDNTLIVWDLESSQALRTLKWHTEFVCAVSVAPDGRRAVSGSTDQSLIVWDLESGQALWTLKGHARDGLAMSMAVSMTPDGRRAVSGSFDETLIVWDLETGQALKRLTGHTGSVNCVSVTPDGRRAVSGSFDETLIVWDLETGQALKRLTGHTGSVNCVSVTPDGKRAVSGSWDSTLMVWDLESGQALKALQGHTGEVKAVSVTPDGRRAVSGSFDKTLIVWDLETGQALKRLNGHTNGVRAVSVTPDGRFAVSGSDDNTLIVWDLEAGQALKKLTGHTGSVNCVSVTPDGRRAVSGSEDNPLIVWDLESGCQMARFCSKSSVSAVAIFAGGVAIGNYLGGLDILNASRELLCPGPGVVTARKIWAFEKHQYLAISVDCPFCGSRFAPPGVVLESIRGILRNRGIGPEDSPYLKLPAEAWEEPGLLSTCPQCGEALKFNPFIAGGK